MTKKENNYEWIMSKEDYKYWHKKYGKERIDELIQKCNEFTDNHNETEGCFIFGYLVRSLNFGWEELLSDTLDGPEITKNIKETANTLIEFFEIKEDAEREEIKQNKKKVDEKTQGEI